MPADTLYPLASGSAPRGTEEQRLSDLYAHRVLDGPSNAQLDRIVGLAAEMLGTPIALISLVDRDRQWFLSRQGLEATETPRDVAFCDHAIRSDQVFVVADALNHSLFRDNPLVQGEPNIRFYAGAPLISAAGHRLGTLCVIDRQPHLLTPYQEELLAKLSAMAMHEINQRRQMTLCPLTGVLTREALLTDGETLLQQAQAAGRSPLLITVVVSGLRQLNASPDGAAHTDQRLRQIATVCTQHSGSGGLVGRTGSGEFSLIWPDREGLEPKLQALQHQLEAAAKPLEPRLLVTPAEPALPGLGVLLERAAAALG
ncbi:MAG: GAF domain-containing protein [Vulcanococcus sp.]